MGPLLTRLAEGINEPEMMSSQGWQDRIEAYKMEHQTSIEAACLDCRGPLSEIRNDDLYEYRCLVGLRQAEEIRQILQRLEPFQVEIG
jgi:hypothetical protein